MIWAVSTVAIQLPVGTELRGVFELTVSGVLA
jgi:hypothetical protein